MADCSKTVDFIRERKRMCEQYETCADGCMAVAVGGCEDFEIKHPEQMVAIVQQWSDAHPPAPPVTWLSKLKSLGDCVEDDSKICLGICPGEVFRGAPIAYEKDCDVKRDCEACWNGAASSPCPPGRREEAQP